MSPPGITGGSRRAVTRDVSGASLAAIAAALGSTFAPLPTAWANLTLVNSWTDLNAPYYGVAQYRRNGSLVELRGVISGGASGTEPFALPVGSRPSSNSLLTATGDGLTSLLVVTDGSVLLFSGVTTYSSLGGISFPAA